VDRIADLTEEAADEPGAEQHEHGDAVGDRREIDRTGQRDRRHDRRAGGELDTREHDLVGPPAAHEPGDHDRRRVDRRGVDRRDERGRAEAAGEEDDAPGRAHDHRLEQALLGVPAQHVEREEHRDHGAQEERREHRQAEQRGAGEDGDVDVVARRRLPEVMKRRHRPERVQGQEEPGQDDDHAEHPPARALAQRRGGDHPDPRHGASPSTASR